MSAGSERPADVCMDAAEPDMPVRYQDEARRAALHDAFTEVARTEGREAA